MNKLVIPIFLLFSLFSRICMAQTDCSNYMEHASKSYRSGRFDEAINIIKTCGAGEKNEISKWQSSRLMAQCYLGLNNSSEAKKYVEEMLEKNPLYEPSLIEDSKDFVKLLKSIPVVPRFSLSLSVAAGINISYPNIMKSYSITNSGKTYENGKAQQIGLFAGLNISDRLGFQLGGIYEGNNYNLNYDVENAKLKYGESLKYFQVPALIRYRVKPKGSFKVFIQGGVYSGFLLKTKYAISRESPSEKMEMENIDASERRNKYTFGAIGGTGLSYKFREGHVFAEVNYHYSFTDINLKSSRLLDDNLIHNYYFIDDDLRLNNLTFSIGYTFYLNYFVEHKKEKK